MKMRTILTCAVALAVIAPVAMAQPGAAPKGGAGITQKAPAAPKTGSTATPPVNHGPPIAGVCIYSKENMAADTKIGQYVDQRLRQIQATVSAQLNQANSTLQANVRNVQAQLDSSNRQQNEANQQAVTDVQRQAQEFVAQRTDMQDRFDRTADAALSRVFFEGDKFLQQVYEQHHCSILFDGAAVVALNPAMDLTNDVTRLVDGAIQDFQFDLLPSTAAPAAGGATGAAGAAPAGAPTITTPAAPARGPSGPRAQ